jgi:tyrosine-protein kinase Etk/Wzc
MSDKHIQQLEETNLKNIFLRYFRYWYLFAGTLVLCLTAAFFYLRYATKEYEVTTTLLIKDDRTKSGQPVQEMDYNVMDLFVKKQNSIENEMEVLKSRSLLQKALQELNLETTYYTQGKVKETEIYGPTVPVKVVHEQIKPEAYVEEIVIHPVSANTFKLEDGSSLTYYRYGQKIKRPYATFAVLKTPAFQLPVKPVRIQFNNLEKLASNYSASLTVAPTNVDAKVLSLSYVTEVPQKGIDILNKLLAVYNEENIADKNKVVANTIQFINDRLEGLAAELEDVEGTVAKYKQQTGITDVNSDVQMYLEQTGQYNQQLAGQDIQLSVLQSIESYLRKQGSDYELVPSTLGVEDETLQNMISQFNNLQLERTRILRTANPSNPIVVNINEQLGGLRGSILENIQNMKRGVQVTRNNLRANSGMYQSKIQSVPGVEKDLLEIKRQQGVKENLYLYLLQKREESTLSLQATGTNSKVIDHPKASSAPVSPKSQLVYLCALIFGLGLPFSGLYLREMMNEKIETLADVEKLTNAPVLGEINHSDSKGNIVVRKNSRNIISEFYRLIRTNLQFVTQGRGNQVILVTSSMSQEGKTFFSINFASSLALTEKRVVILDFDLRKPKLLADMGIKNDKGISNYLLGRMTSIEEIIKPSNVLPNLSVIGAGSIPEDPAELMMNPRTEHLIEYLKTKYDYVIIDTSPVGQVADAFNLAQYTDCSIYIMRYNYTLTSQVKIFNDIFENEKLKFPMVVLNDAKKENFRKYGYGYGYSAGYAMNS